MPIDPNVDPFQASGGGVQVNGGWVPRDHPLAQQAVKPPAAPSNPGAAPGQGIAAPANQAIQAPATVGATPAQGSQSSVAGAFQQALVNRLAPTPVSAQSPEIAPAIAAQRGSEQRSLEQGRAQLAEQAAAQGLDPNAFGSQLRGLQAESAQRSGQFAGQATLGLAQQRAQELTSALALGGQMMSEQDRMAISRELAELQAQLQREGVAAQTGLGRSDLALRDKLGSGQLNLGLLGTLLNNEQFGQNLGATLGMFGANQNQQAMLRLLGL